MELIIQPVTLDHWLSLEDLFGKKGACNGCWCMYWRIGAEYKKRPREENRLELKAIIENGPPPGLIATQDEKAVGWCQVTPKNELLWLMKDYSSENDSADIWCISCFYIRPGYRGKGITLALVREAVKFAKESGAKVLEAYARESKTDSFTGFPSTFLKAGFQVAGEGKYKRKIMKMDCKKLRIENSLKDFLQLKYKMMIPVIKNTYERKLLGKRVNMSLAENKTPELWRSFMPVRNRIANTISSDLISMSVYPAGYFSDFNPAKMFDKWAAVEVSDFDDIPEGLETFILPAGLYAVFDYKGLSSDPQIFQYIFGSWLPGSDYNLDNRPHFEILGEKYKNNDPDSEEEIWIPVSKK